MDSQSFADLASPLNEKSRALQVVVCTRKHQGSGTVVRSPIRIGPVFQQDFDHGEVAILAGGVEGGHALDARAVNLDGP